MSENYGFPPELLEAPADQRLEFFKNPGRTIMHRKLKNAYNDVGSIGNSGS